MNLQQYAEDGEAGMSGHYAAPSVDPEDILTESDTATLPLHCTEAPLVKERESNLNPALDQTAVRIAHFFNSLTLFLP